MTVVPFNENTANKLYRDYYNQKGGGQTPIPIPVYRGQAYQKGYGIGSVIGGLFKSFLPVLKNTALPILKCGAKSLGKTALKTGFDILSDGIEGRNLKTSAAKNLSRAGSSLLTNALSHSTNRKRKQGSKNENSNKRMRTNKVVNRRRKGRKGKRSVDIFS